VNEAVSFEEILQMIRDRYESIDTQGLYFVLREIKFKPIRSVTVDFIRWCVAIESTGLPITPYLVSFLAEKAVEDTRRKLHTLGDKRLLVLCKGRAYQQWVLGKEFKEVLRLWKLL